MTYFRSVSRIFSNLSGFRRRATPPRTLPDASKTLTPPNPTPVLSKHSRVPFSSTSSNRPSSRSPSTGFTKLAITGLAAMTGAVLYYQFRRSAHQPPAKSPTESLVQTKLTQIQKYFKPNFSSSVVEAHTSSVASNDPIEDRFSVHQFGDKMIFGIYDGHAGWDCADTLEKFFHTYIGKYLSTLPTTSEALLKAYDQFDQHLMRLGTLAKEDFEKTKVVPSFSSLMPAISGSVLVTAVVSKHQIDVAHAGDCRAILGRKLKDGQWVAIELTKDHDADNPKEKERIQQEHPGEEVISKKRVLGGLQPFRAMGDARYKWPIELQKWIVETYSSTGYPYLSIPANYHTPPYVTAHPEVSSVPITEEDMFLGLFLTFFKKM
ncbi:Pyruvate dehyrogenase phosphatase catalytic subunit [Coelomomyces lativittatus]|nr:Pyruvate dehyrogenase phosphatase catalytic subunit [Coelomomyces lativittatus]